ncbi:MAG: carboxypeptidase-like regulatory domain-containing protein [Fuerstiella sp.]
MICRTYKIQPSLALQIQRFVVASVLSFTVIIFTGCSDSQHAGGTAEGVVSFNGEPLANAELTFSATAEGARAAYGMTDENGFFKAYTHRSFEGIAPGEYIVTVDAYKVPPGGFTPDGKTFESGLSAIPRKYAFPKQSGLTLTVLTGEPTVANFDLVGEAPTEPEEFKISD